MVILEIEHLTKYHGSGGVRAKALDDVSLTLEKGGFTAVTGASGSGKTTLLHMIGGLDVPDSGTVKVDGVSLNTLDDDQLSVFRRRKVGLVFQNYNLIPTLTVYENIVFPLELDHARPDHGFIQELFSMLSLKGREDAYPSQLSGGQQQRAAIARALAAKPAILLADEPTGSLDSKNGQNVAGLLKTGCEAFHQTLVMVTHNQDLALLAGRVLRMEDGRLME